MKPTIFSLVLPEELYKKLEALAKKEFSSKADIMRRALVAYIKESKK